jgi:hypothetical protein
MCRLGHSALQPVPESLKTTPVLRISGGCLRSTYGCLGTCHGVTSLGLERW